MAPSKRVSPGLSRSFDTHIDLIVGDKDIDRIELQIRHAGMDTGAHIEFRTMPRADDVELAFVIGTTVVLLVRNATWIDLVALGVTIIISHLGLLFWELRYISASLAYPGLKPGKASTDTTTKESVSS